MKLFELKQGLKPLVESFKFSHLKDRAQEYLEKFLDPVWFASFDLENNLLGRGGNGSVYKIPGEKELVVKIHSPRWGGEYTHENYDDLEENFGQALAGEGKFSILLYQQGEPAGMTSTEKIYKTEGAARRYFDRISLAANMPQSAYDDLAKRLIYLNEKGWNIDPSKSNNILIDSEREKFSIVDVSKKQEGSDYTATGGDIIVMLCGNTFAYNAQEKCKDRDVIDQSRVDRQAIIEKMMIACQKVGLPVCKYERDSSLEYSMELAGLPKDFYKKAIK